MARAEGATIKLLNGEEGPLPIESMDKLIDIYLSTGNFSTVARAAGRSRKWAQTLFRKQEVLNRMHERTLSLRGNPAVASIEECMTKLTSIMRGDQMVKLSDRIKESVGQLKDSTEIAEAIRGISRFAPQIENNQIKAVTMLMTAQGALDPHRAAKDDFEESLNEIALAIAKANGSDSILAKLNLDKVIDVD